MSDPEPAPETAPDTILSPVDVAVRWTAWDGAGLEHCRLRVDAGGAVIQGVVAGHRLCPYGVHYTVRTDAAWRTRAVRVAYLGGPALDIAADGQGRWTDAATGAVLDDLDGCIDVDIGATPATNALPIRRLGLGAGQSRDVRAAYVPLPAEIDDAFRPRAAAQRYTCLTPGRLYRYEGLFRDFVADLPVDDAGLVLDYPPMFRRVPLPDPLT